MAIAFSFGLYPNHDLTALEGPNEALERIRERLGDRVRIVARAERSQLRNREAALRRLAERVDAAGRPRRTRTPTQPTRSSEVRRRESKRRRAQTKEQRRDPTDED